jgi:hypothetical protein
MLFGYQELAFGSKVWLNACCESDLFSCRRRSERNWQVNLQDPSSAVPGFGWAHRQLEERIAKRPSLVECCVTMKIIHKIAIVGGLSVALMGISGLAQSITPAAAVGPSSPGSKTSLGVSPAVVKPVDKGIPPKIEKPDRTDKRAHQESPDQIKKLLERIKGDRIKFNQEQKGLQDKLKNAAEDQREQIRTEIRDKREQFLEQQKDLRDEVLRQVTELKDQLKDHQDLIDSTKGGKGRLRKGMH